MKKIINHSFIIGIFFVATVHAADGQDAYKSECTQKTQELGNILLSINRKIVAMPPLATIYTSTSNVWDKARTARDAGNYQECVRLNDIGIGAAGSYAR